MKKLLSRTSVFVIAFSLVMSMVVAVAAAAQEVDIKINFQRNLDREAPEGYLIDIGEEFGDRGNGHMYGWNSDHTGQARDNNQANEDRRLATHVHFTEGGSWSIDVPNGTYEITISIGDAAYPTGDKGKLILNANDVTVFEFAEGEQVGINEFATATVEVEVTDGKITLDPLDSANKNIKINYIDIASLSIDESEDAGAVPDAMPKTGMGGASDGFTSASIVFAVLLMSVMTVVVVRKKSSGQK